MLINIVENALKYGPRDSAIRLEISDGVPDGVRFQVIDYGEVIPEEDRERIFDRYHRLAQHDATRGGHGLGLAFCKRVAMLHGGTLHVEPAPKAGNAFVLQLPSHPPSSHSPN